MAYSRLIQIGIIGSAGYLRDDDIRHAKRLGNLLAQKQVVVLYGSEGDVDSLPSVVAKAAKKNSGLVMAFTWGERVNPEDKPDELVVNTCQMRGGGREFSFMQSCEAVICLGGNSGTLMEIAMAYQASIPVIALTSINGWGAKLAEKKLDSRKHNKIIAANNVELAVEKAIKAAMA